MLLVCAYADSDGAACAPAAASFVCSKDPDPAVLYCDSHTKLLCAGCHYPHRACNAARLDDASAVSGLLAAKVALYRGVAATAAQLSVTYSSLRTEIENHADAAVEKVMFRFGVLKAKLDEVCNSRVAEIRKVRSDRLKQLDVAHDELLVRASQLSAAAAMCESAVKRKSANPSECAHVAQSLLPFTRLSLQPMDDRHDLKCFDFSVAFEVRSKRVSVPDPCDRDVLFAGQVE